MGLCASAKTNSASDPLDGYARNNTNTNTNNPINPNKSLSSSSHERKSSISLAESKLQASIKSKRTRKQVVMEAGDSDDVAKMNGEDLRLLKASIPEKTEEQKIWIRQTLENNFFMFNSMEDETKESLINVLEQMKDVPTEIIKQGDNGDYMYLVQQGDFDVVVNNQLVGSLHKNVVFGELALMYDAPRAATISIQEGCKRTILWRVGRAVFKYLIRSAVQTSTSNITETLNKVNLLEALTMDQKKKIGQVLEPISYSENEHIIHQGDEGNIFYIIKSGSVVCRDVEMKSEDLVLHAGDYFGELALLTSKTRQRDVIALQENTICLALDRESFQNHLGSLDQVMSLNMRVRTLECMSLFNTLSDIEKNELADSFETEVYHKGDQVVIENEIGHKFYIVVNGTLQASKNNELIPNGQIGSNGKSNFFGEQALLGKDGKRNATMVVISESVTLYSLSREKFTTVLGPSAIEHIRGMGKQRIEALGQATMKYEDLKQHAPLGCGTFGRVFLVTDKKLKGPAKPMALKCMVKQQIVDMKMTSSINNERAIMSNVEHPFLLRLIATFQDHDQVYMLLDYVCGGELFSRLADLHHLPFPHSRFYAACVLSAFEHLHRKEIIYRDLKPENLLIDREGYLKVVDFGFAKKLKLNKKTFTVCGTPEYLAPEIILRTGHDFLVDIYAVGILIYEMEVGTSPYADPSGNMNSSVICNQILKNQLKFPKGCNPRTQELVKDLCVKKSNKRLGSGRLGTKECLEHSYFRELDFAKLRQKKYKTPWVPKIKNELDTSNFDEYPFDKSVAKYKGKKGLFKDF